MPDLIQKSAATAAYRRLYFRAVDATDGITPETGLTGTGKVSKNGGSTATSTNSIVEIDATNMPGLYYVELTTGEVDTLGGVIVRYKNAACAEVAVEAMIVDYDPYAAPASTNDIADAVLVRDWTAVTGEAARSVLNALRFLRSKKSISGSTLTVTKEDDSTTAWTATLTTTAGADPITAIDPS